MPRYNEGEHLVARNYEQMPPIIKSYEAKNAKFLSNIVNIKKNINNDELKKNFNSKDEQGNNILHLLINNSLNEYELIKRIQLIPNIEQLINTINSNGQSPLHLLCKKQYYDTYKIINNKLNDKNIDNDDEEIIKIYNAINSTKPIDINKINGNNKNNKKSKIKIDYLIQDKKGRIPLSLLLKGININEINNINNNKLLSKNITSKEINNKDLLLKIFNDIDIDTDNDYKEYIFNKFENKPNLFNIIVNNKYKTKFINTEFFNEYMKKVTIDQIKNKFVDFYTIDNYLKKDNTGKYIKDINNNYIINEYDSKDYYNICCNYIYKKIFNIATNPYNNSNNVIIIKKLLSYFIYKNISNNDDNDNDDDDNDKNNNMLQENCIDYILNKNDKNDTTNIININEFNDAEQHNLINIINNRPEYFINLIKFILFINNNELFEHLKNNLMNNLRYDTYLCHKYIQYHIYQLNNNIDIDDIINDINNTDIYTDYKIKCDFFQNGVFNTGDGDINNPQCAINLNTLINPNYTVTVGGIEMTKGVSQIIDDTQRNEIIKRNIIILLKIVDIFYEYSNDIFDKRKFTYFKYCLINCYNKNDTYGDYSYIFDSNAQDIYFDRLLENPTNQTYIFNTTTNQFTQIINGTDKYNLTNINDILTIQSLINLFNTFKELYKLIDVDDLYLNETRVKQQHTEPGPGHNIEWGDFLIINNSKISLQNNYKRVNPTVYINHIKNSLIFKFMFFCINFYYLIIGDKYKYNITDTRVEKKDINDINNYNGQCNEKYYIYTNNLDCKLDFNKNFIPDLLHNNELKNNDIENSKSYDEPIKYKIGEEEKTYEELIDIANKKSKEIFKSKETFINNLLMEGNKNK